MIQRDLGDGTYASYDEPVYPTIAEMNAKCMHSEWDRQESSIRD